VKLLLALGFALASAAVFGYSYGESFNHFLYLPWVLSRLDPSLYPGDPSVAAVAGLPSLFWRGFVLPASLLGPERAAFALWLLSRVAGGWAVWEGVRALRGSRGAGALATALVLLSPALFVDSPLAGDPMFKAHLDQTSFCWPVALWAVVLWLRRRPVPACLLLGALSCLNLLLSAVVGGWLLLAQALDPADRGRGNLGRPAAALLLPALPAVGWALWTGGGDIRLMLACAPQTYLASSWPWERWALGGALITLWSALIYKAPVRAPLGRLALSAALLWAAAVLAAWVPVLHPLLSFQPFRLDAAVGWCALLASGIALSPRLAAAQPREVLAALGICWALSTPRPGVFVPLWAAALLLAESRPRALAVCGIAGAFFATFALGAPPGSLASMPPSAALTLLLFGAATALAAYIDPHIPLSGPARLSILSLSGILILLPWAETAVLRSCPGSAERPSHGDPAWEEAARWARTSTSKDALFLVPPGSTGFRLRSQRPVYAEWTGFAAALWDRRSSEDWKRRMARLGTDWAGMPADRGRKQRARDRALLRGLPATIPDLPGWSREDGPRIAALARDSGASYVIAPAAAGLALPETARLDGLSIHRLRRAD